MLESHAQLGFRAHAVVNSTGPDCANGDERKQVMSRSSSPNEPAELTKPPRNPRQLWTVAAALSVLLAVTELALFFAFGRGEKTLNLSVWGVSPAETQSLAHLKLVRTLSVEHQYVQFPHLVAGASHLAWSPDGQRLAAFVLGGLNVATWRPDGSQYRESPQYNSSLFIQAGILGFLSGHSELLVGPAIKRNERQTDQTIAMSVLDAETGEVVRNIPGLNPGRRYQDNIATKAAISPDQLLVAAVSNVPSSNLPDRRVSVYSTKDWQRIKALSFGVNAELIGAEALAFSPDGTMLAIGYTDYDMYNHGRTYVDIIDVGSWTLKKKIGVFVDNPAGSPFISYIGFNYDSSMIVVATWSGGSSWVDSTDQAAPTGKGTLVRSYPVDCMRVFKISDGQRVNSTGYSFRGCPVTRTEIALSPRQNLIAFLDRDQILYFWNPMVPGAPEPKQRFERATTSIAFSPDGRLLGQAFGEGIRLFEIDDKR